MTKVRIYVEGGGDSSALRTECRQGFSEFLQKAGLAGKMPKIVACGGRDEAYKKFCIALRKNKNDLVLLLVDSEAVVKSNNEPWTHLLERDNWQQPQYAEDHQAHLMAQCMETWLIADADALENYFGQGFNRKNLPKHVDLEEVSKADIYQALAGATQGTKSKRYDKGSHAFKLLRKIDPNIVRFRCSYAERFIAFLTAKNHLK